MRLRRLAVPALLFIVLAFLARQVWLDRSPAPIANGDVEQTPERSQTKSVALVETPAPECSLPERQAVATQVADLWSDVNSPVHNGDRSKPVTLALPNGKFVALHVERTMQKSNGAWITIGHTENAGSAVVATRYGTQTALAVFDPKTGIASSFAPGSNGLVERPLGDFSCGTHAHETPPTTALSLTAEANVDTRNQSYDDLNVQTTPNRITIAGAYTKGVESNMRNFGGEDGLNASMEVGVQLMNIALNRAGADSHFEFVGTQLLSGWEPKPNESGNLDSSPTMKSFDTAITAAKSARTIQVVADYYVGITDLPTENWAGVGNLPGNTSIVIPDYLPALTLAHEVGHNLGMQHDKENASSTTGKAYAYGYWISSFDDNGAAADFGDIMSYKGRRLLTYSDPNYTYRGIPLGDAANADNARLAKESVKGAAAKTSGEYRFTGNNWLINQSTRGQVGQGGDVMIAGMVISGDQPKQVVVRALGPTLAQFGIAGFLGNPKIEVYGADQKIIETSDDWKSGTRTAELTAAGLAPANDLEPALVLTLNPGAYTVVLSGVAGGQGVSLVEAYGIERSKQTFKLADYKTLAAEYPDGPIVYDRWDAGETVYSLHANTTKAADQLYVSTAGMYYRNDFFKPVYSTTVGAHPQRDAIRALSPYLRDDMQVLIVPKGAREYGAYVYMMGTSPATSAGEQFLFVLEPGVVASARPGSNFINLSTRAVIGTGEQALIAGIVVAGDKARTFAFRALGEYLRQFGINNPAKAITVEIFASATSIATYTATQETDKPVLAARNLLTPNATDISGIVTLQPGSYTLVLSARSKADAGVGIVEVYEQ